MSEWTYTGRVPRSIICECVCAEGGSMERGSFCRVTTFVVINMLVFILAGLEGCGGITVGGNRSGGSSITGTVVDVATTLPVVGALVVLEQPDASGIDRVISSTISASNGSFSFNPSPSGLYDVVADASVKLASGTIVTYAATVTFGVPANTNLNQIPLVPEFGTASPAGIPATIFATVSSSGTNIAFLSQVDIKLSALQSVSPAIRSVVQVTIPAFAGSTTSITTATNGTCLNGTTCANYSLIVPEGFFSFGRFSATGTQYNLSTQQSLPVGYTVEGRAFFHSATLSPDCTPPNKSTDIVVGNGTVASGNPNLAFTGCL